MKTQKSYTAILLLLALLFAVALQASTALKSEPLNLLDTPPEVEGVSNNTVSPLSVDFNFEEEEYVNDIPFNTKCVSAICKYEKAMSKTYILEEEAYVDDIPFDTENIYNESLLQNAFDIEFNLEDEAYVDDIPFDTYAVAKNYNYKEQFAHYK